MKRRLSIETQTRKAYAMRMRFCRAYVAGTSWRWRAHLAKVAGTTGDSHD